jgi:hypothetical protein
MSDQNYSAIGYNVREVIIVASTIYPIEAYEEFTTTASIIAGYVVNSFGEATQMSNTVLSGDIVQTRQFVYTNTSPDAIENNHSILYGEIYEAKTLVFSDTADAHTCTTEILSGTIENVGIVSHYNEQMKSNVTIKYGILSVSTMAFIAASLEEMQCSALITNGVLSSQPAPSDPYYNNVSLFMPMFGTDGGTTFNDYSPIVKYATVYGNARTESDQSKYYGSSAYFDGDGDYLTIPDHTGFDLAGVPMTIELWFYALVVNADFDEILAKHTYWSNLSWSIAISPTTLHTHTGNGGNNYLQSPVTILPNTWNHVAVTSSGTGFKHWFNGNLVGSTAINISNAGSTITIGANSWNNPFSGRSHTFNGYIQDLRITKGVERYTANFIPPKQLYYTISELIDDPYYNRVVALLPMNGVNGQTNFINYAQSAAPVSVYGDTHVSIEQYRYYGSSAYFDGIGDCLSLHNPLVLFLSANVTMEFWAYAEAQVNASPCFVVLRDPTHTFYISYVTATGAIQFMYNGITILSHIPTTSIIGRWVHVAVTNLNSVQRLFVEGTLVASNNQFASLSNYYAALKIGAYDATGYPATHFKGYIQDVRFTTDVARYTQNFIPPSRFLIQ